jgi:hypothetical protein
MKRFLLTWALTTIALIPVLRAQEWTEIVPEILSSHRPSLVRDSQGRLHVLFEQKFGERDYGYNEAMFSRDGKLVRAAAPAIRGWMNVPQPSLIANSDGSLEMWFTGYGPGTKKANDPFNQAVLLRASRPADGEWSEKVIPKVGSPAAM